MGSSWGPPGDDRTQVGPMNLAIWVYFSTNHIRFSMDHGGEDSREHNRNIILASRFVYNLLLKCSQAKIPSHPWLLMTCHVRQSVILISLTIPSEKNLLPVQILHIHTHENIATMDCFVSERCFIHVSNQYIVEYNRVCQEQVGVR